MISIEFNTKALSSQLPALEASVAAWTRRFIEPSVAERQTSENSLLTLALDYALLDPRQHVKADGDQDVLVNMLARSLANVSSAETAGESTLPTLAAMVAAGSGNFATACVFAKEAVRRDEAGMGPVEKWLIKSLSARDLPLSNGVPEVFREYANLVDEFLTSGQLDVFASATNAWNLTCRQTIAETESFGRYLLLLWRAVHERIGDLCVARVLTGQQWANADYLNALRRTSSPLLFPSQTHAITQSTLLTPTSNALVLLPTSTGKSLLGEFAILSSLSNDRPLGVYLAPYRALASQIFTRMQTRVGRIGVRCVVRRGGYLSSDTDISLDRRTILVATPESFDALLRARPELISSIACCVFDEFHLVEQLQRGLRYEGLAARLLAASNPGGAPRIVALSPVLTATADIRNWLGLQQGDIAASDWRPTARRIAIATPGGRIGYFTPGEGRPIRTPAWQGIVPFPHNPTQPVRGAYQTVVDQFDSRVRENVAAVARDQFSRFTEPIAVIAMSRAKTRQIAHSVASGLPDLAAGDRLLDFAAELEARSPELAGLSRVLRRGVAYHNAALPDWVRTRIEEFITSREIRVVVATTTLAEGVDLPFRSVVLADWNQFRYGTFQPVSSLLFRNIAGRCGRAGVFAEGDTIIVDNPSRNPAFSGLEARVTEYFRQYVSPAEIGLQSSIDLGLSAPTDSLAIEEVQASLESQFAAFVGANETADEPETLFIGSLFSGRTPRSRDYLPRAISAFADSAVGGDFPYMVRNSPLRLTDFGRRTVATGLTPKSCVRIAMFVRDIALPEEPNAGRRRRREYGISWNSLLAAIVNDGTGLLGISELQSAGWKQVGRHGFAVREVDLLNLCLGWISGVPVVDLLDLALIGRQARREELSRWSLGTILELPTTVEEYLDELVVFLTSEIASQLAWIIRSIAVTATAIGLPEIAETAIQLAVRCEHGASNAVAIGIIQRGCQVDRSKCDAILNFAVEANVAVNNPTALKDWLSTNADEFTGRQVGKSPRNMIALPDIEQILTYLEQTPA